MNVHVIIKIKRVSEEARKVRVCKMELNMAEDRQVGEILTRAVAGLSAATGIQAETQIARRQLKKANRFVILKQGKRRWKFHAEVKPYLTNQSLGAIISEIVDARREHGETALVTPYVSSVQADKLREHNVEFFDTAGNAFFHQDGLYVFVTGCKATDRQNVAKQRVRAFNQTGLRLIFALLSLPNMEKKPYRILAQKAGISLGAVNWIMADLQRFGYLTDDGARGRHLINKKELFKRWVAAYPEQLRPKLLVGRFHTDKGMDWWRSVKLPPREAFWGGEVGAALVTKYLRPQQTTIYAETNLAPLQAKHRLRRDSAGEVELLQKFWKFDEWDTKQTGVVPPVLLYADLLLTAEERNMETAELVYEEHIARLVG